MGRKPALALVGLLLGGSLITGCGKWCRNGCGPIAKTNPTYGPVGEATAQDDKSWDRAPWRKNGPGPALPGSGDAAAKGDPGPLPPVGERGPATRTPAVGVIQPVGGISSDPGGGLRQAGFRSDSPDYLPPPPAARGEVKTEARRPFPDEGTEEMATTSSADAFAPARRAPKIRIPAPPVTRVPKAAEYRPSRHVAPPTTGETFADVPPPSPIARTEDSPPATPEGDGFGPVPPPPPPGY